ncbi:MAG: flavin reductase [delta proteobacterium ML8_D]|jgi:flavin reductase (DIM6/NTAB) family NADH-FMN oxidoreductase RutF|nr:MAG: flavin reductase [delta proteobacterium ML8_D]
MQELITNTVPTGVSIVTVRSGDKINGMTAAWVTQVSFKPVMIAVSIAPQRYTHDLIEQSRHFCINALSAESMDLAKHFGFKSGRKTDKFQGINYTNAIKGSPVLESAYAYIECKVVHAYETGDHTLFIGTVVDSSELKENVKPLIFRWNDFFGKKQ